MDLGLDVAAAGIFVLAVGGFAPGLLAIEELGLGEITANAAARAASLFGDAISGPVEALQNWLVRRNFGGPPIELELNNLRMQLAEGMGEEEGAGMGGSDVFYDAIDEPEFNIDDAISNNFLNTSQRMNQMWQRGRMQVMDRARAGVQAFGRGFRNGLARTYQAVAHNAQRARATGRQLYEVFDP